ncbi:hypothetical protein AB0D86_31715 [Streptomyces sp. NPDC048324]|uniref:hypothetical protein n=1 Tax=Streptomyces sp. NPDC048324 TaxID=3157205 RepID=UPI003446F77A
MARTVVSDAAIAELAELLAVVDGGTGDRCRCEGWPTILIYGTTGEQIACWTLHHQSGVRGVGDCDADLRDGPALTEWLAERGLTRSRAVQEELAARRAEEDGRRLRWVQAAPAGLRDAARNVCTPPGPDTEAWSTRLGQAAARLAALAHDSYPDEIERIRALIAWAGVTARESTGGLKWYDMAVQQQLLAEDPDHILAALTVRRPNSAQLDGAAQLFASLEWTGAYGRQLPEPLRSTLIEHIRTHGTEPMKFRLRHGYYGAERSA